MSTIAALFLSFSLIITQLFSIQSLVLHTTDSSETEEESTNTQTAVTATDKLGLSSESALLM